MFTPRAARSPGSRPRPRSGFPGRLTHPLAGACLLAGTVALAAAAALAHLTWRLLPQALAHLERANDEPRMVRDLPYADRINAAGTRRGVNPALLAALVAVESGFDPAARSPRGALGLTQVLPETWSELRGRLACPRPVDRCLLDAATNLEAGALYLRDLLDRYGGNARLALAAYNAGAGRVRTYAGPPPFPETARYLARMAVTWRVLQAEGTLPQRWPLQLALLDHVGPLRNALAAAGVALGLVALILGWPRLAPGWRGVPALGREVERA